MANSTSTPGLKVGRESARQPPHQGISIFTRLSPYGAWLGIAAGLLSLSGTLLLAEDSARIWSVLLLAAGCVLAILAWGGQKWPVVFAASREASEEGARLDRRCFLCLAGFAGAGLLALSADVQFLAYPNETFGVAGWLWLAGITVLVGSGLAWPRTPGNPVSQQAGWPLWEIGALVGLTLLALALRVWDLASFPNNIYPDEIMTGQIALSSYINAPGPGPSVFRTLWSGIDLPALWFLLVGASVKISGTTLAALRLPAALFGAATMLPFYALVRGIWGRAAAIGGTAIFAFSASNIHYSRLALNNIVTPFFWAACFFFIVYGLRLRQPIYWILAGLSAGLSEYFYYGTRLLPFILIVFVGYLLIMHWRSVRRYAGHFALMFLGYLVGFGPLLAYFAGNPNLYFGRGTSLLVWSRIPAGWQDLQQMWATLWPIMGENLLGISTYSSQDIIYFGSLLLPFEGALLVLGFALLVWHWRHPVAFLVLLWGVGVLFVGGTLVLSTNGVAPLINHWTPAFPAFYMALAIAPGAWTASVPRAARSHGVLRLVVPGVLGVMLVILAWRNVDFYFNRYYADPQSLKTEGYRAAQTNYEIQTVQARYQVSLGPDYRVFTVGANSPAYDPQITQFLAPGQQWTLIRDPEQGLPVAAVAGKGMAFLIYPGDERYLPLLRQIYPQGIIREVSGVTGKHMFDAYVIPPGHTQASGK